MTMRYKRLKVCLNPGLSFNNFSDNRKVSHFPIIGNNKKGGFIMSPEMLASIKELITVIGFPIVCVIFMWRKITDSDEKQTALLTELTIAIRNLTDYIKDKKGDK